MAIYPRRQCDRTVFYRSAYNQVSQKPRTCKKFLDSNSTEVTFFLTLLGTCFEVNRDIKPNSLDQFLFAPQWEFSPEAIFNITLALGIESFKFFFAVIDSIWPIAYWVDKGFPKVADILPYTYMS